MGADRAPSDPLGFIRRCLRERRVLWTHHVNMRLGERAITRAMVLQATDRYEIVEAYPDTRFLPAYLLLGRAGADALHVVMAVDVEGDTVRIVTAYRPDPAQWEDDLKTRRQ
ncbi:MAG TPA: DUF4258 domain-containing protein [bacterium]